MYINYYFSNGIEYAKVCESYREDGSVKKTVKRYLGRVVDKEKSIFKNKENGLYFYDFDTDEVKNVDPEYQPPEIVRKNALPKRRHLGLAFGDVFLITEFIKKIGFNETIDSIQYKNMDTLYSLIIYYITQNTSNNSAKCWWEQSYASLLFPNAQMASQRISEMLQDIGEEEEKRNFFAAYYKFLNTSSIVNPRNLKMVVDDGILIDSTGLPNVSRLPCTAVSNHNGKISEEIRLIYVVQQHTGLPLFYRYVPGNVIDASTIKKTIAELKHNGVNTAWALLDAGYYSAPNADALHEAKISFITRVGTGHKIYKEAVRKYGQVLRNSSNSFVYEQRLYYIIETECMIGKAKNIQAYGYLCLDEEMSHAQYKNLLAKTTYNGETDKETADEIKNAGLFMLVCTRRLSREKILPLYYTRDQVEKVFEIVKQYSNGLPIRVQTEATLRGHLLLTFVATIINKLLADALYKSGYTAERLLESTHDLQCLVYDDEVIINELPKQVSAPMKKLKINVPDSIPLPISKSPKL